MNATICQLCKEPVWNFLCVECIGANIKEWLPQWHANEFQGFHNWFSKNFEYEHVDWKNHNNCLHCKNNLKTPVCPYCYTNEVYLWLKERDSKLASLFISVFNFDFEDSGYKEFNTLEAFHPLSEEENKIMDEGICEVCECYSEELKEKEGKWACESCSEE